MRKAIGLLFRLYAYLYHLILCLFLLGIGVVAYSGGKPLNLGMLPWEGDRLTEGLIGLGIIGLICIFGAITGWFRWLFPLWTLVVFVMMVRGFFLTSYTFSGDERACYASRERGKCLLPDLRLRRISAGRSFSMAYASEGAAPDRNGGLSVRNTTIASV